MTLMFHPRTALASSAKPLTVKRRFRVELQCSECDTKGPVKVELLSEPDTSGVQSDFYRSGAHNLIENYCPHCGAEGLIINDIAYLRAPNEHELAIPEI